MSDVKNFLDKIQEINDKKIKVYSVSLNKEIDAAPLSFKQQKEIISTIADGAVGNLKFQKIQNQLIIDNTGNNDLTIVDKLPILIKLRATSIGDKAKVGDNEVKLIEIINKFTKEAIFTTEEEILGDVKIKVKIPTLVEEIKILNAAIDTLKKDSDELGKNIGSIYTYEIVKYIKSVEYGEEVIDFTEIGIPDKVKIVNSLPISINKQIIKFIENIKKIEKKCLTFEVNGEDHILEIDVNFFDN
jgi:DNA-directed RNA polymerase subunit L